MDAGATHTGLTQAESGTFHNADHGVDLLGLQTRGSEDGSQPVPPAPGTVTGPRKGTPLRLPKLSRTGHLTATGRDRLLRGSQHSTHRAPRVRAAKDAMDRARRHPEGGEDSLANHRTGKVTVPNA